eukprot:4823051-Heterocapsa_arctica.AAC.1
MCVDSGPQGVDDDTELLRAVVLELDDARQPRSDSLAQLGQYPRPGGQALDVAEHLDPVKLRLDEVPVLDDAGVVACAVTSHEELVELFDRLGRGVDAWEDARREDRLCDTDGCSVADPANDVLLGVLRLVDDGFDEICPPRRVPLSWLSRRFCAQRSRELGS